MTTHPILREIVLFAIRLALVEELCKFLGTLAVTWRGKYFTRRYQGLLLPAITGLSFGILETVLYMAMSLQAFESRFWLIVLLRALIGAPGHGAYGIIMGLFYGKAKLAELNQDRKSRNKNLFLAVLIPGCIHGLYDWLVGSQIIRIGETSIVAGIMMALDALAIVYAYLKLLRCRTGQRPDLPS